LITVAMTPDLPSVVAELQEAFEAYEQALMDHDLAAMEAAFIDGEQLVRFGIADRQHGAAELALWRAAQPPLPHGRLLFETAVRTWGNSFGLVTTCFRYPGRPIVGRQSQTWLRIDGTWRIVSAHVSEIPEP
jgi:hypothetical protein